MGRGERGFIIFKKGREKKKSKTEGIFEETTQIPEQRINKMGKNVDNKKDANRKRCPRYVV